MVSFGWFCPIWFVLFVLVWFWSAWLDFGLSVEGGYVWGRLCVGSERLSVGSGRLSGYVGDMDISGWWVGQMGR